MIKSKKQMFVVISVFTLVMLLGSVTYAFFNYTRTGAANRISVGDIYFTSSYDEVALDGVFPIAKTAVSNDTDNVMSVDVDIEGHTNYVHGIYYEITAEDVSLTVNGKNVPIGISVTSSDLENVTLTNYEDGRVLTNGSLFANGRILASDATHDNSVDGTITIKAYLDKDRMAISDTYNGLETDLMGTTNGWVGGRVVLTTSEWNSLQNTPLSFKIKVEAYENDVSTLVDGITFIGKVKKLADPNIDDSASYWYHTSNNNVTTFERVTTVPDTISFTENNIISTDDSIYPIYAWYDNGIIKYYSGTTNIKANVDMSHMFFGLVALDSIGDLSSLDTTNVINMQMIFQECSGMTSLTSLANWNVSNVTDMTQMFTSCSGLTTLDALVNWNVSNVINMHGMFTLCSKLTSLAPLANWNVSNVADVSGMFTLCTGLTTLDALANWNVSNVISMRGMFMYCTGLTILAPLANWNVSNVTDMNAMFMNCTGLTTLDSLANWNVSNVIDIGSMFSGCTALVDTLGINDWNINSVVPSDFFAGFYEMFYQVPTHPEFTKRAGTWNSSGTFIPSA